MMKPHDEVHKKQGHKEGWDRSRQAAGSHVHAHAHAHAHAHPLPALPPACPHLSWCLLACSRDSKRSTA